MPKNQILFSGIQPEIQALNGDSPSIMERIGFLVSKRMIAMTQEVRMITT